MVALQTFLFLKREIDLAFPVVLIFWKDNIFHYNASSVCPY